MVRPLMCTPWRHPPSSTVACYNCLRLLPLFFFFFFFFLRRRLGPSLRERVPLSSTLLEQEMELKTPGTSDILEKMKGENDCEIPPLPGSRRSRWSPVSEQHSVNIRDQCPTYWLSRYSLDVNQTGSMANFCIIRRIKRFGLLTR